MNIGILWAVGAMRPLTTCYVLKTSTVGAGARLQGVKEDGEKWRCLRGQLLVWEIGWKEEIYVVVQGALSRVFNEGPQNPAGWFLKNSYKYMVTEIVLYSFICSFILSPSIGWQTLWPLLPFTSVWVWCQNHPSAVSTSVTITGFGLRTPGIINCSHFFP